jgi:hypothetical protein
MMHTYKAADISSCLSHSHIVYVGDSIARQQFFATLKLIEPNTDTSGEAHTNRKHVLSGLTLEFWWDPYLNETTDLLEGKLPSIKPSLMVVMTGAWQMHHLGPDYFNTWKQGVDRVLEAVQVNPEVADAVLLGPVEIPDYDKLDRNRTKTMTYEKISRMNQYLKEKEASMGTTMTAFGIPFVWNEISTQATTEVTEDGLHYNPIVTTAQAQIALNYRCNDQLDKKFPMSNTCCYTYPTPRWYQFAFMLIFLVFVPVGYALRGIVVVRRRKKQKNKRSFIDPTFLQLPPRLVLSSKYFLRKRF